MLGRPEKAASGELWCIAIRNALFMSLRNVLVCHIPTRNRRRNLLPVLLSVLVALFIFAPVADVTAQFAAAPNETPLNCPAQFITAMVPDGHGGLWVAGEDTGIYHGTLEIQSPRSNHRVATVGQAPNNLRISASWTQFHKANSPGLVSNRIYSLCVDAKGRLWAGTDRHGVCVYNGNKWKHYGILTGPIGSHIIAIANDPHDNSVWMCSESGISVYQCSRHSAHIAAGYAGGGTSDEHAIPGQHASFAFGHWHYITGMDGLPASPDCVAFNKQGTAFVGTLCNGVAIARYPYKHWRVIHGPWRMPRTAMGSGLPSNLINCVSVGRHGTVYVGTDLGLAVSKNNGGSFHYERGADYAAKVLGLWHAPVGFRSPPQAFLQRLLPGDHITSVTQDGVGNLWLGTWRNGYEALNPSNGQSYKSEDHAVPEKTYHGYVTQKGTDPYISQLCPVNVRVASVHNVGAGVLARHGAPYYRQIMLIGRYGSGVGTSDMAIYAPDRAHMRIANRSIRKHMARLPQAAAAPTAQQLAALCKQLESTPLPSPSSIAPVIPIGADWRTQGSWLGRYGRYWACLFACRAPGDYVWAPGPRFLDHIDFIGPHHTNPDWVRFWIQWLATSKRRVLELPKLYLQSRIAWSGIPTSLDRRESEIDDHGETYPTVWQGPEVNVTLHIPRGEYTLSLYEFNKDGHTGTNRDRDYVISAEALPPGTGVQNILSRYGSAPFYEHPAQVVGRIVNFWGGVWHRFLVRGPMVLLIRMSRNYSLDTILCGAMLDPLNEHPEPYYYGMKTWRARLTQLSKSRVALRRRWTEIRDTLPKAGGILPSDYFAKRLLRDEEFILHENPKAWAGSQQTVYTSLLRWYTTKYGRRMFSAKKPALAAVARIDYRLGLFGGWEALEERQNIMTSRHIEEGLRWDGVQASYRGLEAYIIRRFLQKNSKLGDRWPKQQ